MNRPPMRGNPNMRFTSWNYGTTLGAPGRGGGYTGTSSCYIYFGKWEVAETRHVSLLFKQFGRFALHKELN